VKNPNDKYGEVSTKKVGSECEFFICSKSEWDEMTEKEQEQALIDAMWESGLIDVYPLD
jgi:hypothetical protein